MIMHHQMSRYHTSQPLSQSIGLKSCGTSRKRARRTLQHLDHWYSMDDQYDVSDMEILPSDSSEEVPVEDEYKAYVLSPISRQEYDLVQFWAVSSTSR